MSGFGRLLRAEWTKFTTVRGWVIGMLLAAFAMVLVGLLGTAGAELPQRDPDPTLPVGPGGEAVNDSFYFVHQPLTGDGSITVPVTALTGRTETGPDGGKEAGPDGGKEAGPGGGKGAGADGGKEVGADGGTGGGKEGLQPWAKAGLIVKEDLTQGSSYAAIMATGAHGVRMQHDYVHDVAGSRTARWLRLVRSGSAITGYESADGVRWREVATARPDRLPATVQVGLFVTSPQVMEGDRHASSSPAMATATFGRADLRGAWRPAAFGRADLRGGWRPADWKGEQLGRAGTSGSYAPSLQGGFTRAGDGFTISGAGDIAPVVGGVALGNGFAVEHFLVGAFAALIMVIVGGTMSITAEYRRGLIRTTLTATPDRARVLAAKAIVLAAVAFTMGLAATLVSLPIGRGRARAKGFHVLQVTSFTEVRVVIGTGLLIAMGALLALGLGALLRRAALAVTLTVASVIVPYMVAIAGVLPAGASEWLLRITPAAGFAVQQSLPRYAHVFTTYTPTSGYYPLSPLAGFAVLTAYTATALALAAYQLRRKDA
ncbi:ABC transporter permease subunit [Spirillospora sp. CA-294931]|uniref:ABC transporter permease subunit n=1 Tax=Spirillospora sp. CA-294931 TaxID=3240042 RepID=UPI003D8E4D98